MKKREIYCEECVGLIKNREELVVTRMFYYVLPYHDDCYARALKGYKTAFVNNTPLNGKAATFAAILVLVASLVIFIFSEDIILVITMAILTAFTGGLRLASWLMYERHLDE
jgi:hypothetical protein